MSSTRLLKVTLVISILIFAAIFSFSSHFSSLINSNSSVFAQQSNCFYAKLTGKDEVPSKDTNATGFVELNASGNNSMSYKINVTDIKKVTSVHIHRGITGENGPSIIILFKTNSPAPVTNGVLSTGNITSADLEQQAGIKNLHDFINLINKGEVYVHVHTGANPQGEIRGDLISCNME